MEANNAKLREALMHAEKVLDTAARNVRGETGMVVDSDYAEAARKCRAALAAPVRNCDVYDGHQAWVEWQHYCADNYPSTDTLGFAAWLLAPAKEAMIE